MSHCLWACLRPNSYKHDHSRGMAGEQMAAESTQHILVTVERGLQTVTFNRPHKKNAMTRQMYAALERTLREGAAREDVLVTALTGTGDYFSSGNDLSAALNASGDPRMSAHEACLPVRRLVEALIDHPKLLVAVVNGPAVGIAATLLGLCDAVYASDQATFSTPFTRLGLIAEACSSYTFPRIMGHLQAMEMLCFNKRLDAHEARRCGLVSEVLSQASLAEVWPRLHQMTALPRQSVLATKRLVRQHCRAALHEACRLEYAELQERIQSEECAAALVRFMTERSKL
ncbi:enoyl-CoA delta isomerase 2 isoform X2 [Bacillus rossius redtenbacheri]|uniref:enoyl-CoA delta isomerase 2 isoform X2 n=1 Tax=Bacillus rossius redtenbacheri TaxID=93214 RepID=UPI002FDE7992